MSYNGPAPHCGYCYKTTHEPWCIELQSPGERAFETSEREWLREVNWSPLELVTWHRVFVAVGVAAWLVFLWRVA